MALDEEEGDGLLGGDTLRTGLGDFCVFLDVLREHFLDTQLLFLQSLFVLHASPTFLGAEAAFFCVF